MSVSGISSSSLFNYRTQGAQKNMQQLRQGFQQLGQDLQSGNLSAAQTDCSALQQLGPQSNSTLPALSNNPIAQEFNQLSQDLQSGNVSAAQQDYTRIQQGFQTQVVGQRHPHHHRGSGNEASALSQLLAQLGQALQSGGLSAAQQAYSTLQQDFQQFGQSNGQSSSSSVSVNA